MFYWRGFALWRKAINGFNDNVDKADLEHDLHQAADEFDKSASADPAFVDSNIALGFLLRSPRLFRGQKRRRGAASLGSKVPASLESDAQAAARVETLVFWGKLGPIYWNIPADRGGGQAKAMETYEKGLETIRSHKNASSDPLDPSWGEPELLMSLAWSNLNRSTPDLKAAEQSAQAALALVPYWHYVRDILMVQIRDAKAKQNATG